MHQRVNNFSCAEIRMVKVIFDKSVLLYNFLIFTLHMLRRNQNFGLMIKQEM